MTTKKAYLTVVSFFADRPVFCGVFLIFLPIDIFLYFMCIFFLFVSFFWSGHIITSKSTIKYISPIFYLIQLSLVYVIFTVTFWSISIEFFLVIRIVHLHYHIALISIIDVFFHPSDAVYVY